MALKGGFFFYSLLFSLFSFYLPLGKGMTLYLNNILCQVWLKLDQWFWRGKLHQFAFPLPLWKMQLAVQLRKKYTIIPYIPGGFVLNSISSEENKFNRSLFGTSPSFVLKSEKFIYKQLNDKTDGKTIDNLDDQKSHLLAFSSWRWGSFQKIDNELN